MRELHDDRSIDVSERPHLDIPSERVDPVLPTKEQISLFMAHLGRKGGKKGGKRRLETMSSRERSRAARRAALTRWKKLKKRSKRAKK